jgi:hypothetical protein
MKYEGGTSIPTYICFSTRVRGTTACGTAGSMTGTGPITVSATLRATRR